MLAPTPQPPNPADAGVLPAPAPAAPVRALRFGPVQLETNLLLAPIAGYCDLAFRTACRRFNDDPHAVPGESGRPAGLGLACTDLLSPAGLLRDTARSLDLARTNDADKPIGMQLYGGDAALMGEGAKWAADHGATVVDINMGCPVDKVTKKDGGSKLMVPDEGVAPSSDPSACRSFSLALRIAESVRAALPDHVPLTAKMRLGWSCADDAPRLACALADVGVVGFTIHGRTTEQKFKGEADWRAIGRVVEAVRTKTASWPSGPIPVVGNGDVKSPEDARRLIEISACDGVMIGRGALGAPWIFRDTWAYLTTGVIPPEPAEHEKIQTVRTYFDMMIANRDERYALHQIRARIAWFGKRLGGLRSDGRPESIKPFKEAIRLAQSAADVHAALDTFLAGGLRG